MVAAMKKTQFIELFANIRKTIISFISIMMFVALAVGVFVGTNWTSDAAKLNTDINAEDGRLFDLEITFPYGINEEDFSALSQIEGVDEIEGIYSSYQYLKMGNRNDQIYLLQLSDSISKPYLVEGRMPEKAGEIAVMANWAEKNNVSIGSAISFVNDDEEGYGHLVKDLLNFNEETDSFEELVNREKGCPVKALTTNEFIVTALIDTPKVMSGEPSSLSVNPANLFFINCYMYVTEDSFDSNSFPGYNQVLIRSNSLKGLSSFSNEYREAVSALKTEVKSKASVMALGQYESIKEKTDSLIEYADSKMAYYLSEIQKAEKKIADGEKKISQGNRELNKTQKDLDEKKEDMNLFKAVYKKFDSLMNDYISGKITDEQLKQMIDEADIVRKLEYLMNKYYENDPVKKAVIMKFIEGLDSGDYKAAVTMYPQLKAQIDAKVKELDKQIKKAQKTIDGYKKQLKDYQKLLNEGKSELAKAKEEYEFNCSRLAMAKDKVSLLKEYGCSVTERKENPSYTIVTVLANVFTKLRYSMAGLFLVVGLLVCYSAITRIVNDQIVAIGTKKALGLRQKEITMSFMIYTALAVIIGSVIGVAAGYYIVEDILIKSIDTVFLVDMSRKYFSLSAAAKIALLELVLLLTVTYFACRKILKENAVDLLKGPKQAVGKKHFYDSWKIYQKMSLFNQTIINNTINDKKRIMGTVIGVAGCTALIVSALTLKDNILASFDKTFTETLHFDSYIYYDNTSETAADEIRKILEDEEISSCEAAKESFIYDTPNGNVIFGYLIVGMDDDFNEMITLNSVTDDGTETDSGIWMSDNYHRFFNTGSNTGITLLSLDGSSTTVQTNGFYEYYLANYQMIMDRQSYEKNFGREAVANAFVVNTGGKDTERLTDRLAEVQGYVAIENFQSICKKSFDTFGSVSTTMVAVYMFLSVIMALLVLLNLMVMVVDEKKRELIVLMINGFSISDAKRYVYSDTILLTIAGIIAGLILGSVMGDLSIQAFESEATEFLHRIDWKACLTGTAGSVFLTFMTSWISLKKIDHFRLTDINKA